MNSLQLAIILVASVWAALNTLIAGYNAVNGTRDRILTGHTDDGVPLSYEHRRLLHRNDWIPLKLGLALISLAFAAFLIFLPNLATDPNSIRWVCYCAALLPFGAFVGFFGLGLSDHAAIKRNLREAEEGRP